MSDPLLPADKITEISKLDVLDKEGNKVAFGSLIGSTGTTIVVFIRHFWCGKCKLYIEALSEPDKAAALSAASVKLVVVGCGSWQPIKGYISDTSCPYAVYGDPSTSVYKALSLKANLDRSSGPKPSHLKTSDVTQVLGSLKKAFTNLGHTGKTGDIKQNGGEFIFRDGQCIFAHAMQNTEDHVEVTDLLAAAGVGMQVPAPTPTTAAPAAPAPAATATV